MVNTVGSCQTNKFWNKQWISVKNRLELNKKQKDIIVGSLLGDGTMRIGENARNANFKVEQGLEQKDYVFWKYFKLEPWVFTPPKVSFRYQQVTKKKYPKSWWFRTIRHPLLTEIYYDFYVGSNYRTGKKVIPKWIKDSLTPLVLAVWIMDDGSFNRNIIDISTYAFSLQDVKGIQRIFEERYQVKTSCYRDRNLGHRLYFPCNETKKIIQIIRPYIIPTMIYKIGLTTP